MLRFDKPVPGKDTDARTPESRALSVSWNGPSLIDLVNDLTPRSVMLNPATVLSKLIGDFLVTSNAPAVVVVDHHHPCWT
jgi:hypothetical protein